MKSFQLIKSVFAQGEFDALIGDVRSPAGVGTINIESGGSENSIGILLLVSRLLGIVTVIASVWVAVNVIYAAYTYLTGAGKPANHQKASDILTMSIIGLILIVSTYTFAGLIGLLFFGDAAAIINPTIAPI
ncbi:MAG: hypothetical protein COZ34_03265 [Candidatus Pacebacteria bacterium CG_4_10_14_3_um_filter_34_15]|nr:hypothetical protein [Candidatus Pacearchaeota archaeon]NCQ66056.1 hypothetical protein [Candidatus Paceibacterota bacterium]OIO43625.1 MAG: hypothetical protein AUJ41_04615 [Candidatus Pacebacteria bacterium CG1_02_43_31]PIQ81238.1 MAG: hypothetical protein COV78_01360 [Candidatus Pacebacteria bacterium CG11_big_fil_rev_8_21_14_0_20_34_55]PIX81470.1 MAG: hypothetical protein COZ34_03265 [Candidatus Pacebacteria bacterium CG_4_10_14_3_um_filter_34_15]PJC43655.1 MAG: hypothetical protein CO0